MTPREDDSGAKDLNCSKIPRITTSSSRQWSSSFKNPRIVRVSRAFGGKDRHSKVCTVRGLRDRRIRLSVPTAIQLYDLQDRLGLSQPSKVVDWLIESTKHEIEKLPPLPVIVPSNFTQFHGSSPLSLPDPLSANEAYAKALGIEQSKEGMKMVEKNNVLEKNKWMESQQGQETGEGFGGFVAQNFFPISSQFAVPNMPYNSSYFHWDPPNLSLSQFGGGFPFSSHTEDITPFPSSYIPQSMETDHYFRQINHLQNLQQNPVFPTTLHLISPPMKSLSLTVNHSQENENENPKPEKDNRSSERQQMNFLH